MSKEQGFIQKLVKLTEERFNVICYAYKDTNGYWFLCLDSYDLYTKDEAFKRWKTNWYKVGQKTGVNFVYCYCNPVESRLSELAEQGNLIMNISQ